MELGSRFKQAARELSAQAWKCRSTMPACAQARAMRRFTSGCKTVRRRTGPGCSVYSGAVNRRLRLALLLAALAAAGPSVSAPQAFDASRTGVTIAWFRVTPDTRPNFKIEPSGLKPRL